MSLHLRGKNIGHWCPFLPFIEYIVPVRSASHAERGQAVRAGVTMQVCLRAVSTAQAGRAFGATFTVSPLYNMINQHNEDS